MSLKLSKRIEKLNMFSYKTKIRLHQTDAAGVVFFAELFSIAHDCYEEFVSQELSIKQILDGQEYIIPIAHAEADYMQPVTVSEEIEVLLSCRNYSKSSFELNYKISSSKGTHVAEVKTIHVVIDKGNRSKRDIPERIENLLGSIRPQ